MNINENLTSWEIEKGIYLINTASNLKMQLSKHTIIDVNNSSGYVYLYEENYNFTLYMPINCDLIKADVYALHTNFENGEESEISLKDITHVNQILDWCEFIEHTN
jgi:hypothetical protein